MADWYDEGSDTLWDKEYKNLENGLNADGSETKDVKVPEIGSIWQHYNGATYKIVCIANKDSNNLDYPITVVYEGFTNGKIWCKTLSNFLNKMTSISLKKAKK